MSDVRILTEGDSSLLIVFGSEVSPDINRRISAVVQLIRDQRIRGIVDLIPSYAALLINYNPQVIRYAEIRERIEKILSMDYRVSESEKVIVEIPVCYGGEYGPDIQNIADNAGLSVREVIDIHSSRDYLIYMLGFLPGFCYLGGLDERIHTPRLAQPRLRIREGSVGIGGSATGIYPMESPGGWQLMGMTPVKTFDADREVPILLEAGQYIRFIPVSEEEYLDIKDRVEKGTYEIVIHRQGGDA